MSRGGGGGWGQRTAVGQKVTLHIYDLSPANDYIQPFGLGLYHSGLVIGGNDAGFGGALAVVSAEVETALAGARSTLDLPWLDASYATAALGNAVKVTVDDVQMTGNVGRAAGGGMFACGIAAAITGSLGTATLAGARCRRSSSPSRRASPCSSSVRAAPPRR